MKKLLFLIITFAFSYSINAQVENKDLADNPQSITKKTDNIPNEIQNLETVKVLDIECNKEQCEIDEFHNTIEKLNERYFLRSRKGKKHNVKL